MDNILFFQLSLETSYNVIKHNVLSIFVNQHNNLIFASEFNYFGSIKSKSGLCLLKTDSISKDYDK